MKTFQKYLLFISLFSYIFSETTITSISPTEATLGETVDFTITVENYENPIDIKIGENDWSYYFFMPYCNFDGSTQYVCRTLITFNDKKQLNNLEKILYKNYGQTSFKVNINLPTSIKLVFFNDNKFYTYGKSKMIFETNYNQLYTSSTSIKIGSISITNCKIDSDSVNNIECEYSFTDSDKGNDLVLSLNGENTDYKITIATPPEFSSVKFLKKDIYYVSSSAQDIYFEVDSSYKISEHSFVLVPLTSTNPNITLSSCTYDEYGIYSAKCSGILNKNEVYNIFVDNKKISDKLTVNQIPSSISKVSSIKPNELLISSSATTFTLQVDYVNDLNSATFTLKDCYYSDNVVTLSSCTKVDTYTITCSGTIPNAGYYDLYLNNVKQSEVRIRAHSSGLSKAIKVVNDTIKFTSDSTDEIVQVILDSIGGDIRGSAVALKTDDGTQAVKDYYSQDLLMRVVYKIKFPAAGTYYVYVNDNKQDAYITVTNDAITSSVSSISPTSVLIENDISFTLTVDTNYGIESSKIFLKNDDNTALLKCVPDSSNTNKATCVGNIYPTGDYYIVVNGNEIKDIKVSANAVALKNFNLDDSSNSLLITLNFENDVSKFVDTLLFISDDEIIEPTCKASNNDLICSADFENDANYKIRLDGINYDTVINVVGKNNNNNTNTNNTNTNTNNTNTNNNNTNNNNNNNIEDDGDGGNYINKIKYISLILVLLL